MFKVLKHDMKKPANVSLWWTLFVLCLLAKLL